MPTEGAVEARQGTLTVTRRAFDGKIEKERNIAMLDAERVHLPLTLRSVQPGDRFAPLGMRGTRLVSDYMTDRKKSLIEKERQLVVTDADGNIVWLVNERPSARCCIGKDTRECIILTWKTPDTEIEKL